MKFIAKYIITPALGVGILGGAFYAGMRYAGQASATQDFVDSHYQLSWNKNRVDFKKMHLENDSPLDAKIEEFRAYYDTLPPEEQDELVKLIDTYAKTIVGGKDDKK